MRILFLSAVIFLVGCNEESGNLKLNNKSLENDSVKIKKKPLDNPDLKIILLENGFNQDTVRIGAHNRILFEGVITTDPRSGSAEALEVELPHSLNVLDFEMNKWSKNIEVKDSTFIHISKLEQDSIEVLYTQKFGGYY